MDDDDLENTMRHGLEELANDAPRGDGLWETTTSMIAITPDTALPESDGKPPPRNLGVGDPALFRLDGGSVQGLRPIDEYPSGFVATPPFAG